MTTDADVVLAVNSGSSSVKCALFTFASEPQPLARDTMAGGPAQAWPHLLDWVTAHVRGRPVAGHRIVHGGPAYRDPHRITPQVLQDLRNLVPFAPNHLPDEIALIEALQQQAPDMPQIACFDTAFHHTMPEVARRLPIPGAYDARGVRRYGFHGLSYAFLVEELERLTGPGQGSGRAIIAHLGNGSSLAAIRNGASVDTTMAFTPIAGIVMSTRTGDLDPGVVTYLARTERASPDEVETMLSQRSGLIGISGSTGDMQQLLAREHEDPAARLAVASYVYGVVKAIGAFAAVLDGVETLVFSGGIGEHAAPVRARVCERLSHLGVVVDAASNAADAAVISTSVSRVSVRVIPTNEELMIARAAYRLLAPR